MDTAAAVDLLRETVRVCLITGAPLLALLLAVGLASAVIQTATQLHDVSLSAVPKLLAFGFALAVSLPWLVGRLVEFATQMFGGLAIRL